ncbi:MAG: cytochrome c biogenesis protein CcsA [Phycisphaerae bacterium]|nr:cytochrome c biogenesis protein CcsA [Phycisphaerae bacterium]
MFWRRWTWFVIGVLSASVLAGAVAAMVLRSGGAAPGERAEGSFVRAVDLSPLDRSAVWNEGRLKSFDAFATEMLSYISGRSRVFGQPTDFTYLDMVFRGERYAAAPVIYIKNKEMRGQLAAALESASAMTREEGEAFFKSGMISERQLSHPESEGLIRRWSMDMVRTAKHADAIMSARGLRRPEVLLDQLQMIPPPSGRSDHPWLSLGEMWQPGGMMRPADAEIPGLDAGLRAELRGSMESLSRSWRALDAAGVNSAVERLASVLSSVAPSVYPEPARMALQSYYFRAQNMTWVWLVYFVSLIFLVMSVAYRWEAARGLGMGFFAVAFVLHTVALGWRWYVAGRWPNSNMFEAVTTSVWLGTIAVLVLEYAARRTPMRNLFALGGAAASMCALMAAHYVPQLNASINNMMPVLHDLWLYIHTNVIIASYALIAMASVTAVLYLVHRMLGGTASYARVGGAASLIESATPGLSRRVGLSEVFDGATMVLMELSFVLLWAGIVMGAIWADHSWGRPWGWDPKEVFALNTFLVFLVLVHVRLKVRDKGLWTALLAIAGCGVMLFNWIVINFVISGLHSYA